ncbi:MAG: hypothetical protein AVDCRST_MAG02-4900, partial [uncultured Rubrobacteraceae bacterium]
GQEGREFRDDAGPGARHRRVERGARRRGKPLRFRGTGAPDRAFVAREARANHDVARGRRGDQGPGPTRHRARDRVDNSDTRERRRFPGPPFLRREGPPGRDRERRGGGGPLRGRGERCASHERHRDHPSARARGPLREPRRGQDPRLRPRLQPAEPPPRRRPGRRGPLYGRGEDRGRRPRERHPRHRRDERGILHPCLRQSPGLRRGAVRV